MALSNPSAGRDPVLIPGGVADPDGRLGYVVGLSGAIEALDLASGRVLWTLAETSVPLVVSGQRLVTQAIVSGRPNALRLRVLDSASGKRLRESDPVVFPDWVSVSTSDASTFGIEVRAEGDRVLVSWRASSRYRGGAAPPPEVVNRARKDASGVAQVDLTSGHVEMSPDELEAPPESPENRADRLSHPYRRGASMHSAAVVSGQRAAILELQQDEGGSKLVLNRWNAATGRAEAPIVLSRAGDPDPQVTLDGHHVLVRERGSPEQPAVWHVYALNTGQLVSDSVAYERGAQSAAILGDRLYCMLEGTTGRREGGYLVLPRTLRGVDLHSGRRLWEHPIQGRRVSAPPPLPR